jgi:hypothetical protein
MNSSPEFWMPLPARINVKINSDEQHAVFAHEVDGGIFESLFWNVVSPSFLCKKKILSFKHGIKIKVKLSVRNFSLSLLPFIMFLYL